MSRPTAALPHGVVRSGRRTAAAPHNRISSGRISSGRISSGRISSGLLLPWVLVGATVLVQIVYPLVPGTLRTEVTVTSVLVFCAAALADAARVHGVRGPAVLLAVAGGGGLLVEAVGVHTGVPFGPYAYTGDLGAEVLGVPVVVPLAWAMMAWPALVVGRTLARRPVAVDGAVRRRPVGGHDLSALSRSRTALVGGVALAAWDLFLDPQMVDAGHWTWAHPDPGLPLVPGVPLTNYGGWLVVSVVMVGVLDRLLPPHSGPSGPAAALYLWTYGSSVLAHVVFFGRPGSALVGGLLMGALALPFARALWTSAGRDQSA
jgi:putative membrane protein